MAGINVWLLVYLIGSVPLLAFLAAGLSGWVYDYPMWLFIPILCVFLAPLVLLLLKVPSAPFWNITLLWGSAGLITVRILYGVLAMDRGLQVNEAAIMGSVIIVSLAWAIIWTWYFLVSERIAEVFA